MRKVARIRIQLFGRTLPKWITVYTDLLNINQEIKTNHMADSPEVKGVIGFGTKSARHGATPKSIQFFYRSLMVASTIWAIVIEPIFTDIPLSLAHHIDQVLIAGNTAIYMICKQFGWVAPSDASKQTTEV